MTRSKEEILSGGDRLADVTDYSLVTLKALAL